MSRQEYALPLGEARKQQVDGERQQHDDADLRSVGAADIHRLGVGGRLRHHGVEGQSESVNGLAGNQTGAGIQDKEPDGGHQCPSDDFCCRLLLKQQADHGDQRQEDCPLAENLVDDEI